MNKRLTAYQMAMKTGLSVKLCKLLLALFGLILAALGEPVPTLKWTGNVLLGPSRLARADTGGGTLTISAQFQHACGTRNGMLYCWGNNDNGQSSGGGGSGSLLSPTLVANMGSGVTAVAAGWRHTCAIKGGALYCWGRNNEGQAGGTGGTTTPVANMNADVTAVAAGQEHTCAIRGGALYCWGSNARGQTGGSNTSTPVSNMTSGVTGVAAGQYFTCAIKGGAAYCWGDNSSGQSGGGGTTSPVSSVLGDGVTAIAAGYAHACAIKGGALYCWGSNSHGQLGGGSAAAPVTNMNSGVTAVAAGQHHTCAIKNGQLYCWGHRAYGQLGDGSTSGTTATPVAVNSPMNSGVVGVALGAQFSVGLRSDRCLYSWGFNNNGQLGDGTTVDKSTPVAVYNPGGSCIWDLPAPGPFSKSAPANGATGQPTNPTLSWGTASGVDNCWKFYYHLFQP